MREQDIEVGLSTQGINLINMRRKMEGKALNTYERILPLWHAFDQEATIVMLRVIVICPALKPTKLD